MPPPIDAQLGSIPTAYAIAAAMTHVDRRRIGFIAILPHPGQGDGRLRWPTVVPTAAPHRVFLP